MHCPKCKEGTIEATSKVYFDAELSQDGDTLTLDTLRFSHLNDGLDGHPCTLESELELSCDACGHVVTFDGFSDALRARITPQPIGKGQAWTIEPGERQTAQSVVIVERPSDYSNVEHVFGPPVVFVDVDYGGMDLDDAEQFEDWARSHEQEAVSLDERGHAAAAAKLRELIESERENRGH